MTGINNAVPIGAPQDRHNGWDLADRVVWARCAGLLSRLPHGTVCLVGQSCFVRSWIESLLLGSTALVGT